MVDKLVLAAAWMVNRVIEARKERRNRQESIQRRVNASLPAQDKKDLSIADEDIQLTILKDNRVNLEPCTRISYE